MKDLSAVKNILRMRIKRKTNRQTPYDYLRLFVRYC